MNNDQLKISVNNEVIHGGNGFKIIEINISDPSENIFAVVTPVKIK